MQSDCPVSQYLAAHSNLCNPFQQLNFFPSASRRLLNEKTWGVRTWKCSVGPNTTVHASLGRAICTIVASMSINIVIALNGTGNGETSCEIEYMERKMRCIGHPTFRNSKVDGDTQLVCAVSSWTEKGHYFYASKRRKRLSPIKLHFSPITSSILTALCPY